MSGKDALEKLARNSWDIYLVDIKMPGLDGLELQRKIKATDPSATIILMSALASVETAVEAMKQGAYDYVVKPIDGTTSNTWCATLPSAESWFLRISVCVRRLPRFAISRDHRPELGHAACSRTSHPGVADRYHDPHPR